MKMFIEVFGKQIPLYGLMIVSGIALANVIAYFVVKKRKLDMNDLAIIEAFGGGMGFLGAKLMYLFVSIDVDWSRFFEKEYFEMLMSGGFVFYGGVLLGIPAAIWFGKINKINSFDYLRALVFLIPFCHAFGRIGCFCAGCCYGVPYDGAIAVTFPLGTAPSLVEEISRYPVQLVEAGCLFLLAGILAFMDLKLKSRFTVEAYLILYAFIRFALENYRGDGIRGIYGPFSTSQWVSIGMLAIGIGSIVLRLILAKKKKEAAAADGTAAQSAQTEAVDSQVAEVNK